MPIWLTITDQDGIVVLRTDIAEYNLDKSFARAELMNGIQEAVEKVKESRE